MNYRMLKILLFVLTVLFLNGSSAIGGDTTGFNIMNIIGRWEGEGVFEIPMAGTEVTIEGSGTFVYDSLHNRIRTSMYASKFMLTYSDSGYLQYYPKTDSVSWEIWDSWGKHALYWGVIEQGELRANRVNRRKDYRVSVRFPHPDTLDFQLFRQMPDSTEVNKAKFLLWRVE